MSLPSLSQVIEALLVFCQYVIAQAGKILLSPGGSFSLASLLSALAIAVAFMVWKRRHRARRVRLAAWIRAIFPRALWRSASSRADFGLFLYNSFIFGLLFGWAMVSAHMIDSWTNRSLVHLFGAMAPTSLPGWVTMIVLTVAIFLAYELGYWLHHYLSHRLPFMWEFHKVHHTAEVLSPVTNFRVHPVDTVVFVNVLALFMGVTGGLIAYLFGKPVQQFSLWNANAIIMAFTYLLDHLHHTHFWISFTGVWGRVLLSPAHHQIHHSTDPAHFNKNMGSCLAIFDWMFGTLHVPAKERQALSFGVEPKTAADHTTTGILVTPLVAGGTIVAAHARRLLERARGLVQAPSLEVRPPRSEGA